LRKRTHWRAFIITAGDRGWRPGTEQRPGHLQTTSPTCAYRASRSQRAAFQGTMIYDPRAPGRRGQAFTNQGTLLAVGVDIRRQASRPVGHAAGARLTQGTLSGRTATISTSRSAGEGLLQDPDADGQPTPIPRRHRSRGERPRTGCQRAGHPVQAEQFTIPQKSTRHHHQQRRASSR